ncbi:hypothetical protein CK203_101906 [Vitis vinifera]|uniref:Uncharacterized protein n=1 Tax=Vitis vinifera TaxID=29760 RepID=A0A438DIA1_VITVI|nr:hypothetical protein CK203_101906 [Vitis vinifera]
MEQLLQLLKSNPPATTVGSLAQLGSVFSITSCSSAPQIIDLGAFDHITSISNWFQTYIPCPDNKKDWNTGKMIGNARMQDGLYYLDEKVFKNKQVQSFGGSVSYTSAHDRIMFWHLRLGHTNFLVVLIRKLFVG